VKKTTAQDAPRSTIVPWDDLRVAVFSHASETEAHAARRRSASGAWSHDSEPCTREEAVDAVGPVDAQNAPTGPWKTADGFPQAPTAIIGSLIRGESRGRHQTKPATGAPQLPSSAAVASGAPFANPSPAEIVVAERRK
jgi:hypothetical protein